MKFRIVTGKQPETFNVEVQLATGDRFKPVHEGLVSEYEARMMVTKLQEEMKGKALWQPGVIIEEFDSE